MGSTDGVTDVVATEQVSRTGGNARRRLGHGVTRRIGLSRRVLAAVLVTLFATFALVGCGSANPSGTAGAGATATGTVTASDCPTSNTTSFAKTKFVLHVGLAAGTFHRYLYKPFKAGTFTKGAHGRTFALVKAGTTVLFDVHELKLAIEDVKANPTLCKLIISPLSALADQIGALKSKVLGGDTSILGTINTSVAGLESMASKNGASIVESIDQSKG